MRAIFYRKLICAIILTVLTWPKIHTMEETNNTYPDDIRLLKAAEKGDLKEVREALENGARVNTADELGTTPLQFAMQGQHLPIVQLLVEYGADINQPSGLFSELPLAIPTSPQILDWLIDNGAPITLPLSPAIESALSDPLRRAIATRDEEAAKKIIDTQASSEEEIRRAFTLAAAQGSVSLLQYLVNKFSSSITYDSLHEAATLAASAGHIDAFKLIMMLLRRAEPEKENGEWDKWLDGIRRTFSRSLFLAGTHRNRALVDFILTRSFNLGLNLDLTPLGSYVTRLLRNSALTQAEREDYTYIRKALIDIIMARRESRIIEGPPEVESQPSLAHFLSALPVELIMLISSFLRPPSEWRK